MKINQHFIFIMNLKKNYFNPLTVLLLTLFSSAVLFSCSETEELDDQIIEQVQYELEEGKFITVHLNPDFDQQSREFISMQAYDDHLDQLEEVGDIVTVNKDLYEELSHYFNPYEISLLDNNNQVKIGDILYRADQEAAYQQSAGDSWEKIVHYGESGLVDLHETTKVYENLGQLHLLENYKFQSPEARRIYEEMKGSSGAAKTERLNRHIFTVTSSNISGANTNPCTFFCTPYIFNYPNGFFTVSAELRVIVYNEEFSNWGLRAKSGTALQIRDISSNGRFGTNWVTPSDGTRVGAGAGYRPYVYLKHVTSNNGGRRTKSHVEKFGFKWSVEATGGRKGGWKTLSNHYVNFRDPGGTAGLSLIRIMTVDRFDDNLGDL